MVGITALQNPAVLASAGSTSSIATTQSNGDTTQTPQQVAVQQQPIQQPPQEKINIGQVLGAVLPEIGGLFGGKISEIANVAGSLINVLSNLFGPKTTATVSTQPPGQPQPPGDVVVPTEPQPQSQAMATQTQPAAPAVPADTSSLVTAQQFANALSQQFGSKFDIANPFVAGLISSLPKTPEGLITADTQKMALNQINQLVIASGGQLIPQNPSQATASATTTADGKPKTAADTIEEQRRQKQIAENQKKAMGM